MTSQSNRPVIVGAGFLALDVVLEDGHIDRPLLAAGGTCGNVLAALSFLGWRSYPVARLRNDPHGECLVADLARAGVQLDWVAREPGGSTPVVVQRLEYGAHGQSR